MVAVALMMAAPAQAQIIKFGVKGGLNLSKISFSEPDLKGDNQTGWFIGPMAEFTIPLVGIGVDAAALYSQSKLAVDSSHPKATLKTIEIPVNLKWTFGLGSTLGVYLAAGPKFGFNVGNKNIGDFVKWDLEKSNTSFNVGAGLKLIKHLQLGVNYNFALSDVAVYDATIESSSSNAEPLKVKNNSWQVSLAYIF